MKRRTFLLSPLVLYSFSSIAQKLSIKKNLTFDNLPSTYYAAFFNRDAANSIVLSFSKNGLDWSFPQQISYLGRAVKERDPSIIFSRNKWLLAVTHAEENVCDFKLFASDDLSNWKEFDIKLNGDSTIFNRTKPWGTGSIPAYNVWAPNLVLDKNSNIHVFISILENFDVNFPGEKKLFFGIYSSKLTFGNMPKVSSPVKIELFMNGVQDKYSRIDPCVVYVDDINKYIMAVKRENFGCVDFFYANDIYGPYEFISTLDFYKVYGFIHIEGPALVKIDGLWYVFFDSYYNGTGIGYCCTYDFKTFTHPVFDLFGGHIRHGSVGSTDSLKASIDVKNFLK